MMPKKNGVNIWSDQLTPIFRTPILPWSDQMQRCAGLQKSERRQATAAPRLETGDT